VQAATVSDGPRVSPGAGILTVGFGTTVAMWAVGYVGRLPALLLPSPLLLGLLLVCQLTGGVVLGRHTGGGWRGGAAAGLLSGTLNLLVLGSFLTGPQANQVRPSALLWVPGSILVAGLLGAAGSGLGARFLVRLPFFQDWPAAFARVAIAATLLLLAVGGLVTSKEAGLAVVDWPNSFGYNMFLYPFSRMTGPIYYEHAHRLFGALVGLTTLVLALLLWRLEPRRWVRRIGWLALVMVVIQGILGGLRVTGRFTMGTTASQMAPSLTLALVHGVLAQLFFATLVALGAFTSPGWRREREPQVRPSARFDQWFGVFLVGIVITQLVLGAAQRHFKGLLMAHIIMGVAVVAPLALNAGVRAWGLNPGAPLLQRLGLALLAGLAVQVALGFAAYVVIGAADSGAISRTFDVTLSTSHQWFGALLLGLVVTLTCWNFKLLSHRPGC